MSIWTAAYPSGSTLYGVVRVNSNKKAVIISSGATETYTGANIASYAVAFTDNSGGDYTATIPTTLPIGVSLGLFFFLQAGGSPVDGVDRLLGSFSGQYDGVTWQDDSWQAVQIVNLLTALSASSVSITSPVDSSGNMTCRRDNDYLAVDGLAFNFSGTFPYTLVGATGTWYVYDNEGVTMLSKAVTIVSATQIQLELTNVNTHTLQAGNWRYEIKLTLADGSKESLVGNIKVNDQSQVI